MKAKLEFDGYEERGAFEDAWNGTAYRAVLQEFDEWLKCWNKNLAGGKDEISNAIEKVQDQIHVLCEAKGVTVYD